MLLGTGCGFHLRSQYSMPTAMTRTYVQGDSHSPIVVGLKRNLRSSNAEVVEQKDESTAVVRVFDERTGRRVLSVGGDGNVTEYELFYSVSFELAFPGNDPNPAQTLRLTRDYVFDSLGVLSSSDEEATLRSEMQRDLVRLMMLRLQAG